MAENKNVFDNITELALCGFVFTLPFSKSMVEVFFSCAFVSWFLKKVMLRQARAFKLADTPLNLPIFGFTAAAFLSMVTSHSFSLSLRGFFSKVFEWILIYFIAAETVNSKRVFAKVLVAMILSIALVGIDGLYQCVTGVDFLRGYPSGGRFIARGPFTSRNGFAGWLIVMIPLAFSLVYAQKDGIFGRFMNRGHSHIYFRALMCVLAGILILCMISTYSRGAIMAVSAALLFFAFFRKQKALFITMVLVAAFFFLFSDYVKQHIVSMVIVGGFDRVNLWQEALNIIEDFPLTGCGINTYAVVGPYYKVSGGGGCYPHNSYLQMAAESGLLGLGAFIWTIAVLFKTSLADIDKIRHDPCGIILVGLLAGLTGFLIHSFVDVNIYTLQLGNLMWFVMALIMSARRIAFEEAIK